MHSHTRMHVCTYVHMYICIVQNASGALFKSQRRTFFVLSCLSIEFVSARSGSQPSVLSRSLELWFLRSLGTKKASGKKGVPRSDIGVYARVPACASARAGYICRALKNPVTHRGSWCTAARTTQWWLIFVRARSLFVTTPVNRRDRGKERKERRRKIDR